MGLNVVMMATGEFALPSFRALLNSPHRLTALITQPDRVNPRGKVHPHPLKELALEHNIPVLQPESINTPESIRKLQALRPDVVAVAAYGQILKADVINVPSLGMYNLHASLLPRHRGAAPIQYAIWKGDKKTGVTIFRIEPKLDAGPMIVKRETEILPRETTGKLHDRLAIVGAEAFLEAFNLIEAGNAKPLEQDDSQVTQSPKIRKEQGAIDWSLSAAEITNHLYAMQPWPNPFTFLFQADQPPQRVLILDVAPADDMRDSHLSAGSVISADNGRLIVQTGSDPLELQTIQKAGKKPMAAADFLRGVPLKKGDHFGPEQA